MRVLPPTQPPLSRRIDYCTYNIMQTPYHWALVSRERKMVRVRKSRFPGDVRLSSRAVVTVCHEHAQPAERVRQNAVVANRFAGSVKSKGLRVGILRPGGSGRKGRFGMLRCV
jgi:hypothetical protein